jgi:hypothetical protein
MRSSIQLKFILGAMFKTLEIFELGQDEAGVSSFNVENKKHLIISLILVVGIQLLFMQLFKVHRILHFDTKTIQVCHT